MHLGAEYIPSLRNQIADCGSRKFLSSREWEFCPAVFKHFFQSILDLFAFRLWHQLPRYIAWRPYPQSLATCAFQQDCKYQFPYAFPLFSIIGRVLKKVQKDQISIIIVMPA